MPVTKAQALLLLEAIPASRPSLEPCHVVNWPLWFAWCEVKGRTPDASPVWTEHDVAVSASLAIRSYLEDLMRKP